MTRTHEQAVRFLQVIQRAGENAPLILPDLRCISIAPFEFLFEMGKFRGAAKDSFDASDRFDAFLDRARELQSVAVGGVVDDEDFHGYVRFVCVLGGEEVRIT